MICLNFRLDLSHSLTLLANVPLGDVLVKVVIEETIVGYDCLTASLCITGVNGTGTFGMTQPAVISHNDLV